MAENAPQDSGDDRVINTPQDLADALTEEFLNNAEAGNHAANDALVKQLLDWKRGNNR